MEQQTAGDVLVNSAVEKIENLFKLVKRECESFDRTMALAKDAMKITYPRRFMDKTSDYKYETLAGMALMAVHFDAEFSIRVLENQYDYIQPIVDNDEMRKLNAASAFESINAQLDEFFAQNEDERILKCGIARCIFNHNVPNDPPYAELITIFKNGDQMTAPYWRDPFFWSILNNKVSFTHRQDGGITFGQEMRDSFYSPVTRITKELNERYGKANG